MPRSDGTLSDGGIRLHCWLVRARRRSGATAGACAGGALMLGGFGEDSCARTIVEAISQPLLVLDDALRVEAASPGFYQAFGIGESATLRRRIFDIGDGQWNVPKLRELLAAVLCDNASFDDVAIEHDFGDLGRRVMVLKARRIDRGNLILLAIRDGTEQQLAQTRQQAFLGELQHRVKNILNNVRAIAVQTRRGSRSLDEFFAAFEARLGALARAQDLLVRGPSQAVPLGDLARVELESAGADEGSDFTMEGPSVDLSPQEAQALVMVIHELTTNAARHGALNTESGRIEIAWRTEQRNGQQHLCVEWRERGVEVENPDPPKGFGSRIILGSLRHMLGGTAEVEFHPDGLACRLIFPHPE